jgi:hypothetical protein
MKRNRAATAAFVAAFRASSFVMAWSGTAMAAGGKCNGVFNGKTPNVISKTADKTEAYAGQTVTFTISFNATGAGSNVVTDCYRVDSGSNSSLNALVTGFNATQTSANGAKGTLQHVTFQIVVPSGLVGHSIVDRAKATKGSKESRSQLVSVSVVAPPSSGCTGSSCGGNTGCTTNCGTNGGGTTVQGKTIHKAPKTSVKGVQLAHTGPMSAQAAFLGSLMVMIGLATRIKRRQTANPMAESADNSGSAYLSRYDKYLQTAMNRSTWS